MYWNEAMPRLDLIPEQDFYEPEVEQSEQNDKTQCMFLLLRITFLSLESAFSQCFFKHFSFANKFTC